MTESYCVWYRIRHRHDGKPSDWMVLGRPYDTMSDANFAVAARARMSGAAVEYAVLEEGVHP